MNIYLKRAIPLLLLIGGLLVFFYFDLQQYLSFTALKQHRDTLSNWTKSNYVLAVLSFMSIYIAAVAISVPGATFLTLIAGFLFGILLGTLYVVVSATIGALCVFFAVKTALEPWIAKKASPWIAKMRQGFQQGAFSYLLILRLIPLFPFWVVNIVPALLGVNAITFLITTFLGIIPGSLVYVLLGSGLDHVFAQNQTPNLKIIFTPPILIPLLALALLSLVPLIYQKMVKKRHG